MAQPKTVFYREGRIVPRPMASISCARRIEASNHRILYFFSGKNIVVISHGISKESEVPAEEINRAMEG